MSDVKELKGDLLAASSAIYVAVHSDVAKDISRIMKEALATIERLESKVTEKHQELLKIWDATSSGGFCRDCADIGPTCRDGLPCDPTERALKVLENYKSERQGKVLVPVEQAAESVAAMVHEWYGQTAYKQIPSSLIIKRLRRFFPEAEQYNATSDREGGE